MPTDSLDELKKKFIVDEGELEIQAISENAERLMEHCKVSSSGKVLLKSKKTTDKNKVGLVVMARLLANRLDGRIKRIVSAEEISEFTGIKLESVHARAKELFDEGFILRPEKGSYVANANMISDFLARVKVN